ncbi:MAG: dienelactone hydrolase family protein [Acidimicrobiia bacterium]
MGETVEFPSNGSTASGYLAVPASGSGPGVIVVQEWWGLNPQIKGVADRLAEEGFVALAPDLYHGEVAGHQEMDKAAELMAKLPPDRAARDMSCAVDYLVSHPTVRGERIGVIGFCMGGGLCYVLAALRPDRVGAIVPYYGVIGVGDPNAPDWSRIEASILGHYAENDEFFPPRRVRELEEHLKRLGKDVQLIVYPGTGHAFANETDPLGTYNPQAAALAWSRTVEFLRSKLS